MKIVCVGGGPAGLYFAISTKRRDPQHEVVVVERNPRGVTYGWGVVFWDDLLDALYANDRKSACRIRADAGRRKGQELYIAGSGPIYLGGDIFAVGRRRLLEILADRALELGVDVQFGREARVGELADADLVVACDGVESSVRAQAAEHFGTSVQLGRNRYIWLGTHKVFDCFTFDFERTHAGWIWVHAYRFDARASTFIVECSSETWEGLGLDRMSPGDSMALLEAIFARQLDGCALINQRRDLPTAPWLRFSRVANERWYHERTVLMGDAAHTTHFTIGSGTKLAIDDAIELAEQLHRHADRRSALEAYDRERRAALRETQRLADHSAAWFENVASCIEQDPIVFARALVGRRQGRGGATEPTWDYRLHVATQRVPAVRRLRTSVRTVRGRLRGGRRQLRRGRRRVAGA